MTIRLARIEQSTGSRIGATKSVQFGEAYLCELQDNEIGKVGVGPKTVLVVQSIELCKRADVVYVAPLVECKEENAFRFRIKAFDGHGVLVGTEIDLTRIVMMEVTKMRVPLGRLGARDLWRLDKALKDLFGAGSNWSE